jgi:glycine/D-amino acid oxidase-like deaminating enzyme
VSRARVVVIGAGVVGANVAYRLGQAGAEVIVVDAGAPGGETSGASFAWVNSFWKEPRDYHDLNVAGMAEHGRLAAELGGGAWLHQVGNLNWEEEPAAHARLRETAAGSSGGAMRWTGCAPPRPARWSRSWPSATASRRSHSPPESRTWRSCRSWPRCSRRRPAGARACSPAAA